VINIKISLKKKLEKKKYISSMYNIFHKKIFEYKEIMQNTQVKKVIITPKDVLFEINDSANKKLQMKKSIYIKGVEGDYRTLPIEIINFGEYENEEISITLKIIEKLLTQNSRFIFFDIGANIGFYTLKLYNNFINSKKKLTIYAFEPVKSTYKLLKENIKINHIKNTNSKIFIKNFGFSNLRKNLMFHLPLKGSGNASLAKLSRDKTIKVIVRLNTLDDFTFKKKIFPEFIKADVEGMEFFIAQGAKNLVKIYRPIFFLEILRKFTKIYKYNPNEIFNFFYRNNYSAYIFKGKKIKKIKHITDNTQQTNFLFLHNDKHQLIKNFLI
jgi:FkbM family methyltransferase